MNYNVVLLAYALLLFVPSSIRAQAGQDDPAMTTALAFSGTLPAGPMSRYANSGLGVNFDMGYNFTRRHAVLGEFMWNWLYATDSALQPVRDALKSTQVHGHGDLITLTAEYKYELRGRNLGTYFIGGGGFYHRGTQISNEVPSGTQIPCQPVWLWWGASCGISTSGHVGHSSATAGVNGGMGFTIRTGDAPYRWYVETRYHYAPTPNIKTQLIVFSMGIRY